MTEQELKYQDLKREYEALKKENERLKAEQQEKINVGSKWIPCSELPKTSGVYQITRKIYEGEQVYYITDSAYFDGQNTWHNDNRVNHSRCYFKEIVAWQPLPEPYKEE